MPIYSYTALKQGKELIRGEITASNLKDARDVIRKMGLVPTQINEYVDLKAKKAAQLSSLSLSEKIDFISNLKSYKDIGITYHNGKETAIRTKPYYQVNTPFGSFIFDRYEIEERD